MAGLYGLFAHTDHHGVSTDVYRAEEGGVLVSTPSGMAHVPGGERLRELRDALTAEIERGEAADRAARFAGLDQEPRDGHATVEIESHCEWPGGSATEEYTFDAEWWDAHTDAEKDAVLHDMAVTDLANSAGSGASVTGRCFPTGVASQAGQSWGEVDGGR